MTPVLLCSARGTLVTARYIKNHFKRLFAWPLHTTSSPPHPALGVIQRSSRACRWSRCHHCCALLCPVTICPVLCALWHGDTSLAQIRLHQLSTPQGSTCVWGRALRPAKPGFHPLCISRGWILRSDVCQHHVAALPR